MRCALTHSDRTANTGTHMGSTHGRARARTRQTQTYIICDLWVSPRGTSARCMRTLLPGPVRVRVRAVCCGVDKFARRHRRYANTKRTHPHTHNRTRAGDVYQTGLHSNADKLSSI